jgi:type IV secretory pathway VirB10-like protein
MMETLVEAERALTHGLVDKAERLYRQVRENDPKSSIAVMGLARVALERGDDATAYLHAKAALAIDAENPAAKHLVMRLAEVMEGRGEAPPDLAQEPPEVVEGATAPPPPPPPPAKPPTPPAKPEQAPQARAKRPGIVKRLLSRRRRTR